MAAADGADLLDRPHDREQRALDRLQVADLRGGIQAQAVARERLAGPRPLAPPRDAKARARGCDLRHAQVLEHAQRLDEPELLVDECKTELAELSRREWQPHRLAVDFELAVLRLVEAGEDLDQGRLPRTVLPEQAVDLPGENAQVDAAQRSGPAEALRQVAESQARLPGVAHGPSSGGP